MIRPDARSPLITFLLIALVAFGPLSTDMYLPSLPSLVRVFETDVPTVQLTLSAFMVAFALSMLVYGPLSDRFGRRPRRNRGGDGSSGSTVAVPGHPITRRRRRAQGPAAAQP